MDFYTLVRPEHLNHYGYLFGGCMLKWVDEYAYIAALREFPSCRLVTRAMDAASFTQSVNNGALLRFRVCRIHLGRTSATYRVTVVARDFQANDVYPVFEISVTMVSISADGKKSPLPEPIVTSDGPDCD
ncbi:MAG TPA: hotdog domain-containing protein [Lentisphaeria bacterium]|nr:hotdog domain-containing protein [Lentisphaeria bacterium]